MSRLSAVQQDVLSLYRRILREALQKDRREQSVHGVKSDMAPITFLSLLGKRNTSPQEIATTSPSLSSPSIPTAQQQSLPASPRSVTAFAAHEFRRQAMTAKRSDFKKVEYMIRKGEKQIKLLRMPGVKVVLGTHYRHSM